MTVHDRVFTAADFWERVQELPDDKLYELVNGEIIEVPPPKRKNSWLAGQLVTRFTVHAEKHDLGVVFGADGGFILTETNVRVPDVSFVAKDRIPAMTTAEQNNAAFAPDLAVEVISPSESPRKVNEKTTLYLDTGCQQVWNVYPDERVIEVWAKNAAGKLEMEAFSGDQSLSGGDVLPGFALIVKDLFAGMPA